MNQKEILKTFGEISIQYIVALSMHADNMQRQHLGQSVAYGELQFGEVIDRIENLIKEIEGE